MFQQHTHREISGGFSARLIPLSVVLLTGLVGQAALAQIPVDIPLIQRLGVGARAMGLGGAYTAVADDYTALYYNPAGLAQIRRIEFAGAFDKRSLENTVTYLGERNATPSDVGRIQSLGFAYPFPTYRGGFVIGFSYNRAAPMDQEYFREGAGETGNVIQTEKEDILEAGSVGAYQAGLATEVSPNLSLGGTLTVYSGSSTRDRTFNYLEALGAGQTQANSEQATASTNTDFSAVSGTFGAMLRAGNGIKIGLAVHLPENFTLEGHASEQYYMMFNDSTRYSDTTPYEYDYRVKVKLPARVGVGLSYSPAGPLAGLLLSGDLSYADWTQIDYNGPIRMYGHGYAYRSTTDLRAGVEYAFPTMPVRLRAGYISQPLAYRVIGTDIFGGDTFSLSHDASRLGYQTANLVQDRRYITLGAGVLLEQSMTIDLAYVTGSFERSGVSKYGTTVEKQKDSRLIVGAAFRL